MTENAYPRSGRSVFAGLPVIILLVIVSVFALAIVLHLRFMSQVNDCRANAALYPDLQLVSEQPPDFLQLYGALRSNFYAPVPPDEAEDTIRRVQTQIRRAAVVSGDFNELPTGTFVVDPAEGGGSTILMLYP